MLIISIPPRITQALVVELNPEHGPGPPLDGTVIVLHAVVEIGTRNLE
jgi:hypothetical protein